MSGTETRLTWIQHAPEPGDMDAAECGPYRFEICRMPDDTGYALQMRQLRPEDGLLMVWEMDGFSLEEAKARAEGLANQRVPVIVEGERP